MAHFYDSEYTTLQTYSHLYPNKHGEVADRLQEMNRMTVRVASVLDKSEE